MLSGDNGILQKATDAKQTTERAEAKEQAQLDILDWVTEKTANNQDASLDDEKVKRILTGKSYVKKANATSFITSKGEYEIPYSELYKSTNIIHSDPVSHPVDLATLKTKIEAQSGDCMIDENENIIPIDKWSYQIITGTDTCKIEGYDDSDEGITYSAYNGEILEDGTLQYNIPVFIKVSDKIFKLTELGTWALADEGALKSISIPSSVITIGHGAFYYCSGIENLTIPNSVNTIDTWAFGGCSGLKNVEIGNGINSIYNDTSFGSFADCTLLENITIHKPTNSISGAPWGAPASTTITWNG